VDSPRSKGCHDLIKKGAKLCEGVEDILTEFEYMFPATNRSSLLRDSPELPAITLSDTEQAIYDLVDKEESTTDDIIRRSGLPSSSVSVALLGLEMKRLIRQLPGKLFVRNN
jgi:DNA processing protein